MQKVALYKTHCTTGNYTLQAVYHYLLSIDLITGPFHGQRWSASMIKLPFTCTSRLDTVMTNVIISPVLFP